MLAAAGPPARDEGLLSGSPVAIALDLGGTRLKGGVVGPGGAHAGLQSRETRREVGYQGVLNDIVAFVSDLRRHVDEHGLVLVGVGIGAPGPLDRRTGVIEQAPNLGWERAPLATDVARRTGVGRVRLENDANAATFAEAWVGEASGARCLLGVTLGTGIGGGVVIGGRLFPGASGVAGELGHTVVVADGRPCTCGKRGCAETYFSGRAFVERVRELAPEHPGHEIALDDVSPESIFRHWRRGEPLASRVVESGLRALALALAGAVNLLNPDRVVLFGGLTGSWELFGPDLVSLVERYALPAAFEATRFSASRLAWAGVLGAGGLVLSGSPDL